MDSEVLESLRTATAALEDKKAFHLVAYDVSSRSSIADAFLLCSVGSVRQARAVADEVDRALVSGGLRALAVEGYSQGGWILMDYGYFLLHIFIEEKREYYALERLWGDAPEITAELRPDR